MSDAAIPESAPSESSSTKGTKHWSVLLPYIVAMAAQIPLLLYYFSTLWARPHYQFFPLALILTAVFAYMRWPRDYKEPFFSSKVSSVLFFCGIVFGIAAALFSYGWFSGASMVFLVSSLFARTKDGERPGKSLFPISLLLLIILMPPNNFDSTIITKLQQYSATVSSSYLDLLNFKHYSLGAALNFPEKQYDVERACSGIQTFFVLLFGAALMIVSMRRPWYRAIPLLISAAFWAVLMNSLRILLIPVADIMFDMQLDKGLPHDLLGYSAMIIALLLILSTDQLFEFLFGSSKETVDDESRPGLMGRIRKKGKDRSEPNSRTFKPVSPAFARFGLVAAIMVAILGSMQFLDFAKSIGQPKKGIRAFSSNVVIDLDEKALSSTIESRVESSDPNMPPSRPIVWNQLHYERTDRERGSDFGQRSDAWTFQSGNTRIVANVSLDQTFPGWHELTTCYRLKNWVIRPGDREKIESEFSEDGGKAVEWDYIECDMRDPTTGRRGLLLFCFTDASGQPIEAPIEWGDLRSFIERAKNRLFHSLRASLFQGEAYQIQVFVPTSNELPFNVREEVRSQFLEIRKELRQSVIKYGSGEEVADPPANSDASDETPESSE